MEIKKSAALPSDMDRIESIKNKIESIHSTFHNLVGTANKKKQKIALLQYEMEQLPAEGYVNAELPFGAAVKLPPDIARDLIMQEINSTYDSISHLTNAVEVLKNGKG